MALSRQGIKATILHEDEDAPANIDALIMGSLYELKNPKNGKHAIEDRIREGAKKWKKLGLSEKLRPIISNSESSRPDDVVMEEAARRAKWYGAQELIFISHEGDWIRRFRF